MENENVQEKNAPKTSFGLKLLANIENLLVLSVGIFGFISTYLIKFSGGSRTMNTSVFPKLIYGLMVVAGICMFASKKKFARPPEDRDVPMLFALALLAIMYIFFQGVLHVGLVVSTLLFLIVLFFTLTSRPLQDLKLILIACAIGVLAIWLIYEKLIGIVLPTPLLF